MPGGTQVYVGRVSDRVTERDLESFFKGYGRIDEVSMKNGYAFVEFREYRDADDASHDLNGRELLGTRVIVELARGRPRVSGGGDRGGYGGGGYGRGGGRGGGSRPLAFERTKNRLVVENLSSSASWQDLKDAFRQVVDVSYAEAHQARKNEGILEFYSRSDLKRAMEKMEGKELNGKKIHLVDDSDMGGGRGGGGGGRRRSYSRSPSPKRGGGRRSRSRSGSRDRRRDSRSPSGTPPPRRSNDNQPGTPPERQQEERGRDSE